MTNPEVNYTELALRTKKWMKDIGAVWDSKTEISGDIPLHISVEEWAEEFEFPLDEHDRATVYTQRAWQHTKLEMIQMGIPIAVHEFRGHYIGEDGDQASNVVLNVHHALARLDRAMIHLEAIKTSGKWNTCLPKFKGRLLPVGLKALLDKTPKVVPEKYRGVPSDDLALLMNKNP